MKAVVSKMSFVYITIINHFQKHAFRIYECYKLVAPSYIFITSQDEVIKIAKNTYYALTNTEKIIFCRESLFYF